MALKRNERYPGRFSNPTTAQPQGAFKNRTAPSAQDGSYLEQDWANDWSGFFGRLLTVAGFTANGTVDTALSSQYFDALIAAVKTNLGTAAQRNVGTGATQIPDMSSFLFNTGNFEFPNQMKLKYGGTTTGSGPDNNVIFPTAFPAQCLNVVGMYNSGPAPIVFGVGNVSRTGFTFRGYSLLTSPPSTPVGAGVTFSWIALGY